MDINVARRATLVWAQQILQQTCQNRIKNERNRNGTHAGTTCRNTVAENSPQHDNTANRCCSTSPKLTKNIKHPALTHTRLYIETGNIETNRWISMFVQHDFDESWMYFFAHVGSLEVCTWRSIRAETSYWPDGNDLSCYSPELPIWEYYICYVGILFRNTTPTLIGCYHFARLFGANCCPKYELPKLRSHPNTNSRMNWWTVIMLSHRNPISVVARRTRCLSDRSRVTLRKLPNYCASWAKQFGTEKIKHVHIADTHTGEIISQCSTRQHAVLLSIANHV